MVANRAPLPSERLAQQFFRHKRLKEALAIKSNSALLEFLSSHRQRRIKKSQNPFHGIDRNAPNPKKAQYMIEPEGIEIIAHLPQPPLPPGETGFGHFRPVVRREAPVLAFFSERIRRRSGLQFHLIELGLLPGIHSVTKNADRNVSFE